MPFPKSSLFCMSSTSESMLDNSTSGGSECMERISNDWTLGQDDWCNEWLDALWLLLELWFCEFNVVIECSEDLEECETLFLLLSLHLSQKLPEYPDSVDWFVTELCVSSSDSFTFRTEIPESCEWWECVDFWESHDLCECPDWVEWEDDTDCPDFDWKEQMDSESLWLNEDWCWEGETLIL